MGVPAMGCPCRGVSLPWGVPSPPLGTHVVPCRGVRKYRWAKASMGQVPMPAPSRSLPSPSGPSAKAVLVGDACGVGRWAPGTADTVTATAPDQHPPQFSGPAPGPRRWRLRPWPRPPKLPPCPACPWAPLSSPPANGRSQGPQWAGRTWQGSALTCRGWRRTSTLHRADDEDGPELAAPGATSQKARSFLPPAPQALSRGSGHRFWL